MPQARTPRTAGAAAIALAGKGTGSSDGYMDEDDLRVSLKALMWREVGIERQGGNLTGALGAVRAWEGFALRVGRERTARLSLLNMLLVSRLVADAAFCREESRGTHYRRDFPKRNDDRWRVRLVHERGREMVPRDASERSGAGRRRQGRPVLKVETGRAVRGHAGRRERAILVGLELPGQAPSYAAPLEELRLLADTAGADGVDAIVQKRQKPDPATFLGKGKVEEIAARLRELDADVVIVDHDLSPSQARNLEKAVGRAGHRSHGAHPRHLRAAGAVRAGEAAGRARPDGVRACRG